MIAWGLPIVIVLPLLCTDNLGFTQYAASNWCFIKEDDIYAGSKSGNKMNPKAVGLMLIAGKLWEMVSYAFVVVMYGLTRYKFHRQVGGV